MIFERFLSPLERIPCNIAEFGASPLNLTPEGMTDFKIENFFFIEFKSSCLSLSRGVNGFGINWETETDIRAFEPFLNFLNFEIIFPISRTSSSVSFGRPIIKYNLKCDTPFKNAFSTDEKNNLSVIFLPIANLIFSFAVSGASVKIPPPSFFIKSRISSFSRSALNEEKPTLILFFLKYPNISLNSGCAFMLPPMRPTLFISIFFLIDSIWSIKSEAWLKMHLPKQFETVQNLHIKGQPLIISIRRVFANSVFDVKNDEEKKREVRHLALLTSDNFINDGTYTFLSFESSTSVSFLESLLFKISDTFGRISSPLPIKIASTKRAIGSGFI